MKRFASFAALAIAASLAVVPATADEHEDPNCGAVVVEGPAGTYFIVDSLDNEDGGIWIYREANGQEGLQRNDSSCPGEEDSDFVVF